MPIIEFPRVSSANTTTARMAEAVARVALVDADEGFREALGRSLAAEGYAVQAFDRSDAALAYLSDGGEADLVLLDWNAPGMAGVALLREVNARGVGAPVICLAGDGRDGDEEAALAHGALDYVEKTRRLPILLKRMALVLDGIKGSNTVTAEQPFAGPVQVIGDLEIRNDQSRALWKGQRVELTLTEFRMVVLLTSTPGSDVSYREIYDLVHGKNFTAGHGENGFRGNVRAFIKRIRQKFRAVDGEFDCIGNYPGFGYRWITSPAVVGESDKETYAAA